MFQLLNSLSRSKEDFVSKDPSVIKWYTCGPTVYDEAHIGHARNYVSVDIIRRIIEDYLQQSVLFVENITDVDDKIILRGNLHYLRTLTQLDAVQSNKDVDWLRDVYREATATLQDPKLEKDMRALLSSQQKLKDALAGNGFGDVFPKEPDFNAISRRFEAEFFQDMDSLRVRRPHAVTRVTEYIPEIVAYVERIVERGYAYVSSGSVYFDTAAFSETHQYAKLQPTAVGDQSMMEEGEGALSMELALKRSKADFALWKASKAGEPAWDSPWGPGRPGWHIECSCMASLTLGDCLDIHSGGVDLMFPHHDNELAQSEAYFESQCWVKYFIHVGHLHIAGMKMSRSQKNFFSIRQILERHTANQIRMFCATHRYEAPVEFSEAAMAQAARIEQLFAEFFANVKVQLRLIAAQSKKSVPGSTSEKPSQLELSLLAALGKAKRRVDAAFRDNFDTPTVVQQLQALCGELNLYVAQCGSGASSAPNSAAAATLPKQGVLVAVAQFVSKILMVMGFFDSDFYPTAAAEGAVDSRESIVAPFVDAIAGFREKVRSAARSKAEPRVFLELCDDLRDNALVDAGVRLEDINDVVTWKLADPKELRLERDRKLAEAENRARAKAEAKALQEAKDREKRQRAAIRAEAMFLVETDKYSRFDERGVPTHDVAGEPLPKSAVKKLEKIWDGQKKLYELYHDAASAEAASADIGCHSP